MRIGIVGDLDLGGVSAIRAPLMEHVDRGLPITLNLPGEAFVSSAGMALLSEVARGCGQEGRALTSRRACRQPGPVVRWSCRVSTPSSACPTTTAPDPTCPDTRG
ncbi:STAS domain-containing protein, partial [Pseudonocardia sp. ICBG601]|uniref:STAS domain-containing protein n=1 Tax=Pseudonocardia sp. ICBG601 TaxID=2846759 RepID=UPI001CF70C9F